MASERITEIMRGEAHRVLREDYYQDVRSLAEDLANEARERFKDGERDLREWFIERLDEAVDGHQRCIYTAQAIETVLYSDNDGAYIDDFGDDGLVDQGQLNWGKLAWAALRRDVTEELERQGLDVNADNLGLKEKGDDDDEDD